MKVIAVANQKGGQGKTAVTANLSVAVSEAGVRVLAVDADPQFALTRQLLGREPADLISTSLGQVLLNESGLPEVIVQTRFGFDLAPATRYLASAEIGLVTATKRELKLARALQAVADDYDLVLIDCPPNLGLLTVNALAAAHEVLIPVSAEDEGGVSGVGQVQLTLDDLYADEPDHTPEIAAVITRWDKRMDVAHDVERALRRWTDIKLIDAPIPDLNPHHKATPQATPAMLLPIKRPEHKAIPKAYRKLARGLGLVEGKVSK